MYLMNCTGAQQGNNKNEPKFGFISQWLKLAIDIECDAVHKVIKKFGNDWKFICCKNEKKQQLQTWKHVVNYDYLKEL